MPEHLRSGGLITKDGDIQMYLTWYFGSIVAFFILNYMLRVWFENIIKKPCFLEKNSVQKQRYLEKWTSNWHHVIIVAMVYWGFSNEECGAFAWFYNDVCFL
jgi:hypothetical protein